MLDYSILTDITSALGTEFTHTCDWRTITQWRRLNPAISWELSSYNLSLLRIDLSKTPARSGVIALVLVQTPPVDIRQIINTRILKTHTARRRNRFQPDYYPTMQKMADFVAFRDKLAELQVDRLPNQPLTICVLEMTW